MDSATAGDGTGEANGRLMIISYERSRVRKLSDAAGGLAAIERQAAGGDCRGAAVASRGSAGGADGLRRQSRGSGETGARRIWRCGGAGGAVRDSFQE